MDAAISLAIASGDGIVTYRTLAERGYDVNAVRARIKSGELVRLHHGVYAAGAAFRDASIQRRHLLSVRALATGLPHQAVSHQSALAWWGLPVLDVDLDVVHFSGIGSGRARHTSRAWLHPAVPSDEVREHAGLRVTAPALAVAQTASTVGARAGLIAADYAVRTGEFAPDDLAAATALLARPRSAVRILDLVSAHSESPGESWSRLVFADLGLVSPREQVEITTRDGRFVARVDFLFERERVVVEFDGATKYASFDGRDQLMAEKRREDALRALGYRVVRLTWADLRDPSRVTHLLRTAGLRFAAAA